MRWPRSLLHHTLLAMLLAPVALCAGCWEKIEYTGPRTISTAPRTTAPEDQPMPAETTVADATSPPAVPETPPAATPEAAEPVGAPAPPTAEAPPTNPAVPDPAAVATAAVPPPSKSSDDRYGLFTEVGKDAPPPAEATPAAPPEAVTDNPPAESVAEARHTDATPVAAPVAAPTDTAPPGKVFDTHRAAWHLGSRLSLAALANDRRLSAKNVPIWFEDAKAAAKLLGTPITELPEPAAADDKSLISQQAFDYLVPKAKPIGRDIAKQHGAEDAALFEIAVKSNILLLMYTPDAPAGNLVAEAISQAAPKAKLPDELWKPLVEALNKRAPQSDVRAAVQKMHVDVDRYLAERAEQKAQ